MVEFLLITLVISILAMMFGNGFGVVLGLVGLCLSIVLLLIYGLFAGFGVLFGGLYLLLTNLSLGGGIVLACLLVAVVLLVFSPLNNSMELLSGRSVMCYSEKYE